MLSLRRMANNQDRVGELSKRLVSVLEPSSAAAEAYRLLRTNLLYAFAGNPPKVLMVTSPGPGEGKTTVCANLAASLAQVHKTCLVLDCNLRRPGAHGVFDLPNSNGLVESLAAEQDSREGWAEPLERLKVVPAGGSTTTEPAELLGSPRFAEFLEGVRPDFDYVLLDSPPVNSVSDTPILANQVDGVLLVVDAQTTAKRNAQLSVRSLEAVGATVLGTVMNRTRQ